MKDAIMDPTEVRDPQIDSLNVEQDLETYYSILLRSFEQASAWQTPFASVCVI